MKKCEGCGIVLQDQSPQELGYTPKLTNELCQRCYRLIHYDDLIIDVKDSLQPEVVLREVEKLTGLILLVVDLLDIAGSFSSTIGSYLKGRDILLVTTKRDLLPATLSPDKLTAFLLGQLKTNSIKVKGICVLADYASKGLKELLATLGQLADDSLILLGNANSGKSTLLKALTGKQATASRYPGTTLAISEYQGPKYKVYDTPGLKNDGSCLQYLLPGDLIKLIPKKLKKLRSFQITENQSFAIGGLVRLDCLAVRQATVVFYCADSLSINRGKLEKAEQLWQRHYGQLLKPVIGKREDLVLHSFTKANEKIDICISGLGFIAFSGQPLKIEVSIAKNIAVTLRKGMI